MDSDTTLLECFTVKGCERSFALLTEKYAGMVFSVAQRRVGSRELAEEIAQNVFLTLARKAPRLRHHSSLAAWLHRVAVLESAAVCRAENRRRRRHEKLAAMNEIETEGSMDPDSLPLLDDAVQKLKESDRELLFRRFLEGMSFAEIGNLYGIPEATGRKRLSRILKKLSQLMGRKGVTVSAIALGSAMTGHWAKATPAGLAQTLSQSALTGSVASSSNVTLLFAMMTTKISTVTMIALGAAIPFSMQWASSKRASETSAIAVAEDGMVVATGVTGSASHKTVGPAGFSIAALARELRKLPLPNGSLKRELELEVLMHTLTEEQIKQVVPLLKDAPNALALHRIVGAVFNRWAAFDPAAAAAVATDFDKMRYVAQRGVILSWVK